MFSKAELNSNCSKIILYLKRHNTYYCLFWDVLTFIMNFPVFISSNNGVNETVLWQSYRFQVWFSHGWYKFNAWSCSWVSHDLEKILWSFKTQHILYEHKITKAISLWITNISQCNPFLGVSQINKQSNSTILSFPYWSRYCQNNFAQLGSFCFQRNTGLSFLKVFNKKVKLSLLSSGFSQ